MLLEKRNHEIYLTCKVLNRKNKSPRNKAKDSENL